MAKKMPVLRPVAVIWTDAVGHDTQPVPLAPACTFGVLVSEDKTCVRIATEEFYDGDQRGHTTIPRGMVQRIIRLTEARGKNGHITVPEFVIAQGGPWPAKAPHRQHA
jgi:hypothetical protein